MAVARTELERRLLDVLKRIASYDTPDRMRRRSERDWGCPFEDALEMAYENVRHEAKRATLGVKVVKPPAQVSEGHK